VRSRRRPPLTHEQLPRVLRKLTEAEPASGFLVDALWRRAQQQALRCETPQPGYRVGSRLARELHTAGSRAAPVVSELINSHPSARDDELLRGIADDPAVHPCLRARALEGLAIGGSLEQVLEFLAHPIAEPSFAVTLNLFGEEGAAAARAILARGPATETELSACLAVLGHEAAMAARERLAQRPPPHRGLLRACIRALPATQAADIVRARVQNGEAVANNDWLTAISPLPAADRESVIRALLYRIRRIPDPTTRAEKLLTLLDAAQELHVPWSLEDLIRQSALDDRELPGEIRGWFLKPEDDSTREPNPMDR
jgi:hypothetical protein